MMKKLLVLGSGVSGLGACKLAVAHNYEVRVTDINKIKKKSKQILNSINVKYEEGNHSYSNLDWADEIVISPVQMSFVSIFESAPSSRASDHLF